MSSKADIYIKTRKNNKASMANNADIKSTKNSIKMNEQGMVFIPESFGWEEDNIIKIEKFFDLFKKEPSITYNNETEEYEIYFGNKKYILEIPESIKNQVKNGYSNKYIEFLTKKINEGKYVADKVVKNGEYPTDENDIKLYFNYLSNKYQETKAYVTAGGIFTAAFSAATYFAGRYTVEQITSYGGNPVLGTISALGAMFAATLAISSLYVTAPEIENVLKNKELLTKFKEYIRSKYKLDNKSEVQPVEFEKDLLSIINELKVQIDKLPIESKKYYLELLKELIDAYKIDMNKLLQENEFGSEEFDFAYRQLMDDNFKKINAIKIALNDEINSGLKENKQKFETATLSR